MFEGFDSAKITLANILISIGILAAGIAIGWLTHWILHRLEKRAIESTGTVLDDYMLAALANPSFIAIVVFSLYASSAYLPLNASADHDMRHVLLVCLAGVGIYTTLSLIDALLRWYAKDVAATTSTALDDKLIPILRVMVPIIGGLLGAVGLLAMLGLVSPPVNSWLAGHGVRLAIVAVIFLIGFFVLSTALPRFIRDAVKRDMIGKPEEEAKKRSDTLAAVLVTTGQVIIIVTATIMALSEFVDIAPMLAGIGVVGIAVGFGAQSLVKDVLNGLFVIMEGQYHVGDVVRIADISGLVENINLRRTVLRDLDGVVHFVPNGEVRVASNFTKEFSRVNLNITVSYDANLDRAISVINTVGNELAVDPTWRPFILKAPFVSRVAKLGDSGVDINISGDTSPMKQWDVMGQLRKRIKEAFQREGIEMPYPQMKVYLADSSRLAPKSERLGEGSNQVDELKKKPG